MSYSWEWSGDCSLLWQLVEEADELIYKQGNQLKGEEDEG